MKMFAAALLLASVASGLPQFNRFNTFGGNSFGSRFSAPQSVFQSNSFQRQSSFGNTQIGSTQGITADQRAIYLPVMRALLKVMEAGDRPAAQDINTLLVATRELNKKIPKGGNALGGLGNFGGLEGLGGFGIDDLESMGLPATGDMIVSVDGIPHIRTTFGVFPMSDTSLMTSDERAQFLPVVRTFTSVLEKGNADPNETNQLLQQIRQLNNLIPGNIGNSISGLIGNSNFGQQGFSGFSG